MFPASMQVLRTISTSSNTIRIVSMTQQGRFTKPPTAVESYDYYMRASIRQHTSAYVTIRQHTLTSRELKRSGVVVHVYLR